MLSRGFLPISLISPLFSPITRLDPSRVRTSTTLYSPTREVPMDCLFCEYVDPPICVGPLPPVYVVVVPPCCPCVYVVDGCRYCELVVVPAGPGVRWVRDVRVCPVVPVVVGWLLLFP